MSTIETQIREYGEQLVAQQSMITESEIFAIAHESRAPLVGRVDRRGSARWLLMGAAAFVVVVVGVLSFALGALKDSPPSTIPPDEITPSPSTLPPTATTLALVDLQSLGSVLPTVAGLPDDPSLSWENVDWNSSRPDWITAYPGGGYVASGVDIPTLFSVDGRAWGDEPFHPSLKGYEGLYVSGRYALADPALWTDEPSFLDRRPSGRPGHEGMDWSTVLEYDGVGWSELDFEGRILAPPIASGDMVLIQTSGPDTPGESYGLSVDGGSFEMFKGPPGESGPLNTPQVFPLPTGGFGIYWETGKVLLSPTGETWTESVDFSELTGERIGGPRVLYFVPVGDGLLAQRVSGAFAWHSLDGTEFGKRLQPPSSEGSSLRYLLAVDRGVVLFELAREPKLWTSTDGRDWVAVTSPDPRPATNRSELGRVAVADRAIFYWYSTSDGNTVMQIAD